MGGQAGGERGPVLLVGGAQHACAAVPLHLRHANMNANAALPGPCRRVRHCDFSWQAGLATQEGHQVHLMCGLPAAQGMAAPEPPWSTHVRPCSAHLLLPAGGSRTMGRSC